MLSAEHFLFRAWGFEGGLLRALLFDASACAQVPADMRVSVFPVLFVLFFTFFVIHFDPEVRRIRRARWQHIFNYKLEKNEKKKCSLSKRL